MHARDILFDRWMSFDDIELLHSYCEDNDVDAYSTAPCGASASTFDKADTSLSTVLPHPFSVLSIPAILPFLDHTFISIPTRHEPLTRRINQTPHRPAQPCLRLQNPSPQTHLPYHHPLSLRSRPEPRLIPILPLQRKGSQHS